MPVLMFEGSDTGRNSTSPAFLRCLFESPMLLWLIGFLKHVTYIIRHAIEIREKDMVCIIMDRVACFQKTKVGHSNVGRHQAVLPLFHVLPLEITTPSGLCHDRGAGHARYRSSYDGGG